MGRREAFDPERHFVANRDFIWAGRQILAGQPFNDRQDPRRFRQLYDGRYLRMTDQAANPVSQADPDRPDFKNWKPAQLKDWMRQNGVIAHPKTNHIGLIRKALLLWEEIKSGTVRTLAIEAIKNGVDAGGDRELRSQGSSQGLQEPVGEGPAPKRTRLNRQ